MTTEQIIEEREDSIKMKMRFKRFLSGFMAVATLASTIIQPVTVSASELEPEKIPFEQQYAELKDVQDSLDPNEIVKANDIELSYGQEFDVEVDLSGIEGVDESKIKILFHEAKNEAGTDFDTHTPDTYKAVYAVEPVSGHPAYRVSRNITVKEPKTEAITTSNSSENTTGEGNAGETEDIGTADDEETDRQTETEVVTDLTEESETTTDEETGLTVSDVMEQADEEGIDLYSLDEGESVTFMARVASTTSTKKVTVTRGACYQYSDYGYGSYLTYQYTVKFGSVSATAYCIQPEKSSPGSGTYDIIKLSDGKKLAKVCYYGTKASGDDGFFTEENGYGNLSTGARFILVHLAASYANSGDSAFSGASSKAKTLAMKLYNYCISQPNIPDVEMSFSDANVTAYVDGSSQRTKEITFKADELQSITMKLPSGVKLHNVTTGKTSKAGESVVISGGTKFYLSAPLTQVSDVAGSWSATMKGNITKDYSAYKISTGSGSQDLALVFGEGVDDEKYVDFKVTWVQYASVKVIKKDSKANAKLSGAVFGLYSDADCKNLITKLPATDANGEASAQIVKTQDTVYLKEITAPSGYRINATAYNVKLEVSKTTTVTVPDEEQLGQLTVYKEGEVLAGAEVTENGTTFRYEKRRQKGAVYNVYAGADITTAYGTKVYSKGDLVKENLTTDSNGAVILKNLHFGTYVVKEVQAPSGFYNAGEEKTVKLAYAGQNVEVVFSETTFTNDRQKAEVIVTKQDKDTENPLNGGVFGIYVASDITNVDGTVVVKKGTLIEKATTGTDGKAKFSADLPLGFSYEVKEEQAPTGYVRNTEDVYQFAFSYTNDKEAKVTFHHTFKNERVTAKISLQKLDAETKKAVPQGDATLEKAVYGLYARENIVYPDGATGVMYKARDQVATLTTDENGQASVSGLYLGSYYVKEITPPTGYLADENEYDLSCDYEGDMTAEVKRECTSLEQVMKQPFQIIKAANNGKTDADLLKGAGFSAYLVSSLKVKEDGSYDFDSAKPVVIGDNGATEIFTDEKGYACSIAIPYGTYVVRETTTPHNYTPVDDFTVSITENNPNTPQTWRVLLDDEFEAKLKIIKKDDETKKAVLQKNTEFKIYNMDTGKYVEQVTTYPTTVKHKSYFTDEDGYLILPQNLKIGHYRIEEVNAPYGYTLNENYYEVDVDSNTAYQMDGTSGDVIIEVSYENHPVTEEGYSFIFYDSDLHEIQGGDYDNPDASIQEAAYEILKSERMDDLECVKVDYKEFEEMTIQHSKDLLQEGELRATSEIGRNELALNSLSRAEVERGVLYHAQAVLEDMGMEQEVELLAARVYGSRSRQDLYREDSDLDVVLSYRGNIREDSFFNELNVHGIAMAGIKVDINPIAEERITLAEYMKEADAYLDQQEIKKLASDLDNFSYDVDTYEYNDTIENREEQVEKLTEDILNKKTEAIKDWLLEVSEESDIDSDVITARSLLSRLEDTERLSIFDKQPEQEQPEATISFYVAECMEFPVMGEYHNNLTLEEAIKIYESIPAERMHGGKGIGFDLQDGDKDYSGEYELMCWDRVDRELIDMIPHYKESPLVQKAINDMEKYLNEKHGKVQEAGQTVEVKQEVPEAPVKKESVSVEPNWEQNKEPAKGGKGELKKSVLQSLKEFQARAKAQEQKETATEKSKARKKGEVEL